MKIIKKNLIRIILWLLVFYGAVSLVRDALVKPQEVKEAVVEMCNIDKAELLYLVNKERKEQNVSPLIYNEQLNLSAQMKALDMYERGYFAHVSPDGTEPWAFFLTAGYDYRNSGENLALDFCSAKEVFEAWKRSPDHYENMINEKFREVGFGVYKQYSVQHFGRR